MGAEYSVQQIDPSIPPRVLGGRTLKAVADYIASPECQRVVFMVGAGISTAAGIPDFRSPETGLYANLARLSLPRPEAVFDIAFFRENPQPFYALAQELWPGKYRPTLTHVFMKLFAEHGKLQRVFTQNIDTLELAAGVPREKIVFAHGSFDTQSCIDCKHTYPREEMERKILAGEIARCNTCNGLVKPDIVFFGEALPEAFFHAQEEIQDADLVIVMGSSLSVYPFAALPVRAREDAPRVLMNMDKVGEIGSRLEDVVWLGECDDGVRELAEYLGWWEELEGTWKQLKGWGPMGEGEVKTDGKLDDDALEREVEKLTDEVQKSLQVTEDYKEWVEGNIKKEDEKRDTPGGAAQESVAGKEPVKEAGVTSKAEPSEPATEKETEKEKEQPVEAERAGKSEL